MNAEASYGGPFIKNGQYMCCEMKIPAAHRVMQKYDAWFTGLRRDETAFRKNMGITEMGKILKINPLAFWTHDDIWNYIRAHELSYHPLYDQRFRSLGCKPCTTTGRTRSGGGRQGQFERAGRFVAGNDAKECGLHLNV
jgi:phosphoadenosine phosphosulfate reductase